MPGKRGDDASVTQELEEADVFEAEEAVEAAPAYEAIASVGGGGGVASSDFNIYTILLMLSAIAYLGAVVILLFWIKDYSHPEQFLW